jgi:phenylpropionate dioxygenase-like ring-hydroxylating dioxygenase large terminal subunit
MLSQEDNDVLTRVGPGTPMGEMLRQYWIPALISEELPSPDCPPLRVRLLGENLIAFRATSGAVGIVANSCPHRGASLFFGRNEEEGLRCVYHGWKFDIDGNCVDMPSEPAESNFKNKVHAIAYPCIERNQIIWTYMGPRETPPSLPDLEPNMVDGFVRLDKTMRQCNWMQTLEGDIDTSHVAFLHQGSQRWEDTAPGSMNYYQLKNKSPHYDVLDTEFGTSYGARRETDDGRVYWRIAHFLMPFYTMNPTGILGEDIRFHAWVPIDDEHTMVWGIRPDRIKSATEGGFFGAAWGRGSPQASPGTPANSGERYLPETSDWLGKWRPVLNMSNDYEIDREAQKALRSYTGIVGTSQQDLAIQESMGWRIDRTKEHVGTSDSMIIRTRRRLLNDAKSFRDAGVVPAGVDNPEIYRTRSGGVILPMGVDVWEGTEELRKAFVEHTETGVVPLPTP